MVVFTTPEQSRGVSDLREAFEESNLPFRVDLHCWEDVPESFHDEIRQEHAALIEAHDGTGRWQRLSLSDAVTINPQVRLERGLSYPFIDMAAINAGTRCVHADGTRIYSGSGSRFTSGDTLMARITPCLENGKIARHSASHPYSIAHGSTEFIVIRGRNGVTDTAFAHYLVKWDGVRSYAIEQMTGTSGRQRVPVDALKNLTIRVPPLSEQRAIAHVLGTLDDKIELNRRMNETLEAIARTIFQDWFVDFGPVRAKIEGREPYLPPETWDLFPDKLEEKGRPTGWTSFLLSDLAQHHHTTIAPSTNPDLVYEHYSIPAFDAGHEPARDCGSSIKSNKVVVHEGAVLLSKLNPQIQRVWLPNQGGDAPKIALTEFLPLTPIAPTTRSVLFFLLKSPRFQSRIAAFATGTSRSHQRISPQSLLGCEVIVANTRILAAFDKLASPMLDRLLATRRELRELAQLRDTLLPKLISGQIRLHDAEQLVGDIA